MINWLHHILQPHCQECAEEKREASICQSCESLKLYIARLELEKDRLLNEVLHKPEPEKAVDVSELKPVLPRHIPWKVRQQALEENDRAKAKILRQHEDARNAINVVVPTGDLEKELLDDMEGSSANQAGTNKS